ncbi:ParB/RepB/Spo0J family partition protein [Lysobacter sp. Hz 25]|uniref:ParB/RepB/Spo0J family partition protein n=1 Tax=Lysobacter sp. Hz 25 TaxID=3383698 RepID=UPI0038D41FAD
MVLECHPLCLTLPDMAAETFDVLLDDIRINGQQRPIVLYDGMILDGRHRYRACVACGIEPRVVDYDGTDPVAFVFSENVARRHLTETQRALVAANLAKLQKGQTMRSANWPISPLSQPQAAELLGVSERSVRRAVEVRNKGVPELVASVEHGDISLNEATKIAGLPPKAQRQVVQMPSQRERKVAITQAAAKKAGKSAASAQDPPSPTSAEAGSDFVRHTLGRVEHLLNHMLATDEEVDEFVARFLDGFDWSNARLRQRLDRCRLAVDALNRLWAAVDARREVAA